jgi:putative transcriptional regulator
LRFLNTLTGLIIQVYMKASLWSERYSERVSGARKRQARLTFIYARFTIAMESELDMTVNVQNRIKEFRIERGWTQQQLADAVGVSRQSINSIERNRYVPSLLLALTFAKVFACSTDELFTLEMKP